MFYTVYITTNLVNGKKYIGKHATSNLEDGYLGSGLVLSRAIQKYGRENFEKQILFVFDTEQEMNDKEAELVDIEIVLSEEYYNVSLGGAGGTIVLTPDHPLYLSTCKKISEAQQSRSADMSRITSENHRLRRVGMYGKKQSDHQRAVVSNMMKGRPKTVEQIEKQKQSLARLFEDPSYTHPSKGKPKEKYTCPHCNKTIGGASNYARYHGDKCKLRGEKNGV
jgi:hypothetical protein